MEQFRQFLDDFFGNLIQKVYLQPPAGKDMVYPCIVVTRDVGETAFADNNPYRHQPRYLVTAIDEDSDSSLYKKLSSLPRSRHQRTFAVDNLNHNVFTMFFEEDE